MKKLRHKETRKIEAESNLKTAESLFVGSMLPFGATMYKLSNVHDPIFVSGIVAFFAMTAAATLLKIHALKSLDEYYMQLNSPPYHRKKYIS